MFCTVGPSVTRNFVTWPSAITVGAADAVVGGPVGTDHREHLTTSVEARLLSSEIRQLHTALGQSRVRDSSTAGTTQLFTAAGNQYVYKLSVLLSHAHIMQWRCPTVCLCSFLSASLDVSKRGAYWDRLSWHRWLLVVGWLVIGWLSRACTVAKRCILGL